MPKTRRYVPLQETPRFTLGQVLITPAALALLETHEARPEKYLARHVCGDWSEMEPYDRQVNEDSIADGARVLSSYRVANKDRIWIITESDRAVTTILLPDDY